MSKFTLATKTLIAASLTLASYSSFAQTPVKNVILMIGDGMGPGQMGLLEEYARKAPNSIYDGRDTAIKTLIDNGVLGMSLHSPADALLWILLVLHRISHLALMPPLKQLVLMSMVTMWKVF